MNALYLVLVHSGGKHNNKWLLSRDPIHWCCLLLAIQTFQLLPRGWLY
jgi:hypothetical protein